MNFNKSCNDYPMGTFSSTVSRNDVSTNFVTEISIRYFSHIVYSTLATRGGGGGVDISGKFVVFDKIWIQCKFDGVGIPSSVLSRRAEGNGIHATVYVFKKPQRVKKKK